MTRHIVPSKNGFTVTNAVAQANRKFEREMNAGERCEACGVRFGTVHAGVRRVVGRHPRVKGCCEACGSDFE